MSHQKQYQPWNHSQTYLLPPSLREWLPEGHLAYFILDVVSEFDLTAIEAKIQAKDARGQRPYPPQMMVALILYGYCVGVFSSRKIERATHQDVAFRVLAGNQQPHFTTINNFRKDHLVELRDLFLQVLKLCQKAGLVSLGHVALDGTRVQGNASKHKAMSYARMVKSERELKEQIDELLAKANAIDASEDAQYGPGQNEEDLPAELKLRQDRLGTIRKAKAELEKEAADARARTLRNQAAGNETKATEHTDPALQKRSVTNAKKRLAKARQLAPKADDKDLDPPSTSDGLPKHEPKTTPDGLPHDKAQMNFTDPDSRIMAANGTYLQGYNCQAAVDEQCQIIVAQSVSNLATDNGNLLPMLSQVEANVGSLPQNFTADSGYWNPEHVEKAEEFDTDLYISTRRVHSTPGATSELSESPLQRMRDKLKADEARRIYAKRKHIVEPVFGQTKDVRGFRRFLLRGMEKVQGEWTLICISHNLLKLHRYGALQTS